MKFSTNTVCNYGDLGSLSVCKTVEQARRKGLVYKSSEIFTIS